MLNTRSIDIPDASSFPVQMPVCAFADMVNNVAIIAVSHTKYLLPDKVFNLIPRYVYSDDSQRVRPYFILAVDI